MKTNGLYYKPITIVNADSSIINKLETSLTDDAGVIIYDRHIFIVEATSYLVGEKILFGDHSFKSKQRWKCYTRSPGYLAWRATEEIFLKSDKYLCS